LDFVIGTNLALDAEPKHYLDQENTMATAKKAPAKKAPAKKAAPKKVAAKKTTEVSFRETAEKAVNIYLGVIGQSVDSARDNLETRRKESEKRLKTLEKRGAKLRAQLSKRFDSIEAPTFDGVVDDVKEQFNKIQEQVEETVENVKEKLTPANA
jgi:flagellar capping protein FliD